MKTRPDFRMPHSFVWLLLVAILCVAILPAAADAKVDRTIATEGDPTDGHDSTGGGGASVADGIYEDHGLIPKEPVSISLAPFATLHVEVVKIFPVWVNGEYSFVLIYESQFYRAVCQ